MLDAEESRSSYSWKRDPLFWAYSILMFLPIVMVFTFYNYYSLDFLVYAGWILLIFSVVIILLAGGEFRKKGEAPKGESIVHTTVLVDSGVYAVVRHPQYLGFILFVLGLVLMSQHWLSVISGVLGSALFYKDILREERMSIEKFGDDYRRYMELVPRMNFFVGILRLLQRRRKRSQVLTTQFNKCQNGSSSGKEENLNNRNNSFTHARWGFDEFRSTVNISPSLCVCCPPDCSP